jgi:hypothetical protein
MIQKAVPPDADLCMQVGEGNKMWGKRFKNGGKKCYHMLTLKYIRGNKNGIIR